MNIFEEIKTILAEILDMEDREITQESYLLRELGAESIDLIELAAALSVRFRIEVNEADIFLQGIRNGPQGESVPFLTAERIMEIAADGEGGPVVKVKDLVSYVAWRLKEESHVAS